VTLNGITQNAALDSHDNFSTTFNTSALQAASSPYTIEFSYGGDIDFNGTTGSSKLGVMPGPVYPANSLVTVLAPAIQLRGTTTVTLQARDPAGNDEITGGLKVTFALGDKTGAKGTFSAVKDNHNGTYSSIFTGTLDGNNIITATINGLQVPATAPIAVEGGAFSTAESIVRVSPAPIVAGTTTIVTLQAEYLKNNDEPAGGLSVLFKLGSTRGGQGAFSAVTDHGNGTYTAVFTGTRAGANTIKATIDGKAVTSTPPSIQVVTGPLDLANSPVTLSATSMKAGGTVTITFQPQDAGGNKLNLSGTPLPAFFLASGNGTFGNVNFNSAAGSYSASFTTTTTGSYTIETSYNNLSVTSKAPTVTVTPGAVSTTNSLVKVSETSVPVGSKVTVTLQVVDLYGNSETAELAIAFTLGSGSGKGTFGKVTYLGNGLYQANFTPLSAGTDKIEAEISGVKAKSIASLSVTAG
jgi:adhesin/invasin